MNKGDNISGFEILDIVNLEELKATGIWARHNSGAEVFHVKNDDPENLFGFAFSTAPDNSSGVSHILEHSVLCGSEKYPLKDTFLVLAQGSLQTFLNAWTFPDKTVYPASTTSEKDYFNLMSVYADAVFRPLLSEWTFMQEGWRLVPSKAGLEYTGVVYNEMKGAYSSMDNYAGLWSVKAVMPGTPYAYESGGDPDHIPNLSWEELKAFHRARYAPANCRIFLAGNIPTEKQLAFLDNCLNGLEPGNTAPAIPKVTRWKENALFRIPCPGKEKPQAIVSWLCTDSTDTAETMALACLAEILLGHDGSPLTRALVESALGEDLSPIMGVESELRETIFSAGLRGIVTETKDDAAVACRRMEDLILDTLRKLVNEGIPKEEIDAALLNMEFSHREIKRSHGPYSLVWMRRSLRTWLYGKRPWDSLLFMPNFAELKRRIAENHYLESLIEKHLLNNPHRALVIIEGKADYLEKKDKQIMAQLKEKEKQLSAAEKKLLKEKNETLELIQCEKESKQALDSIPHLLRRDLAVEIVTVPAELTSLGGSGLAGTSNVPCMIHPLFTNGVSYIDMAFPVDMLNTEDYPWLPFFARAAVSMGLPGMDYGEVSSLLARTAGGFYALLETGSPALHLTAQERSGKCVVPEELLGRDWIVYRIKALDEKLASALDLARRLITEADFSDLRRLRDLAMEMKNDGDSSLAPSGHSYASGRSGKFFSRSRAVDELWNGLDQIPFTHALASMDMGELQDRMTGIRNRLVTAGLMVNITTSGETMHNALKAAECFNGFGGPGKPNPECKDKEKFFDLLQQRQTQKTSHDRNQAEVFASPSLQVGFASMSLCSAPYGSEEHAAELVFSHELSTGALWESIRMMGGAYGAFAHPDNLEGVFSFSTYRDPDPFRSLGSFPEILKKRGTEGI
ncbi:MAG: insulinase family protein, partial [Treponema sp.]|nr:insulinase family protein [Treponema sp.]